MTIRLRVPELLAEREMTAYAMHKASRGRISLPMAYRLAKGTFGFVSSEVLDALCEIFEIEDPGPLLVRAASNKSDKARKARKRASHD